MSELKNNHGIGDEPISESPEVAAEVDPFASLNKMLEESPEFKSTFDSVMSILGDDAANEEGTEVECVEIDGHDYIIAKKIEIAGNIKCGTQCYNIAREYNRSPKCKNIVIYNAYSRKY